MVVHGAEVDMARARGCGAFRDGKLIGLATYAVYGDLCEILSLDCLEPELGMGTRLVERVKAAGKTGWPLPPPTTISPPWASTRRRALTWFASITTP